MFDSYRRIMGIIEAKETDTEIILSGMDGLSFVRDVNKHWKTEKITQYMFNTVNRSSISFYKFFALEVLYMVDEIRNYRNRYTSVKTMAAVKEALYKSTWLKNTLPENNPNPKGRLNLERLNKFSAKFKPHDYQLEYLKNYSFRLDQWGMRGDLLDAAAGVGKTFLSSALAQCLDSKKIIVFCPKSVIETVWLDSLDEMFEGKESVWSTVDGKPYAGQRWIVAHYEQIQMVLNIIPQIGTDNVTTILDESHNLNDMDSLRTQLYMQVVKGVKSRNILEQSGTPLKAMGIELIPFMRLIDPLFTQEVEFRFRKMFGKEAKKGADIIRNRLKVISYKIEKKEIAVLPPIKREHKVVIPNGELFTLDAIKVDAKRFIDERWVYYNARRKDDEAFWAKCIEQLKNTQRGAKEAGMREYLSNLEIVIATPIVWEIPDVLKACTRYEKEVFEKCLPTKWIPAFRDVKSVIKYTNLKIQGECLGRIIGGKRIEAHVAMVPFIDWVGIIESSEKKTLSFTSFVEALEAADVHTRKIGFNPITVYGKNTNELARTVEAFGKNKKLNPLHATYASLSTGVRLTMADTLVMINSPFRQYILEQAVSRIYRLGQDSQCYVYQVSLDTGDKPNISTRSKDILAWSQQMVAELLGTPAQFVDGEDLPSLEALFEGHPFDENRALHRQLSHQFEPLGIEISNEWFDPAKVVQHKTLPGFMSW